MLKAKMLLLLSLVALLSMAACAEVQTEVIDGITWQYEVVDGEVVLQGFSVDKGMDVTQLTLPMRLGGNPVRCVDGFSCSGVAFLTVPETVTHVKSFFKTGKKLKSIIFQGNAPSFDEGWCSEGLLDEFVFTVNEEAEGWGTVPGTFMGYPVVSLFYDETLTVVFDPPDGTDVGSGVGVSLAQDPSIATNKLTVVLHYSLDGTEPSTNSPVYNAPLNLQESTTIKARLYLYTKGDLSGYGPVCSATYTAPQPDGGPYTDTVDDRTWTFRVANRKAYILRASHETPAVPVETDGALTLPATLGGRPVAGIDVSAFERCRYLRSVTFPATLESIASFAFKDCLRLTNLVYQGASPTIDLAAFDGAPVPGYGVKPSPTTNAVPVAVDVQGDVVNVPDSWLEELELRFGEGTTNAFFAAYGTVLSNALLKASGKHDLNGNPLYVWQDWVAGTNPVDRDDVLTAWIDMTAEGPVITWTPVLPAAEAALRVYAVWGAKKLGADAVWQDVTALTPAERKAQGWRFFHVTVRMKAE